MAYRKFDLKVDPISISYWEPSDAIIVYCNVCDDETIRAWPDVDPSLEEIINEVERHFKEIDHE